MVSLATALLWLLKGILVGLGSWVIKKVLDAVVKKGD